MPLYENLLLHQFVEISFQPNMLSIQLNTSAMHQICCCRTTQDIGEESPNLHPALKTYMRLVLHDSNGAAQICCDVGLG